MESNLVTKEVDFFGDTIMCVQDGATHKIYVGVKWICNGIGLSEDQIKKRAQENQEGLSSFSRWVKFNPPYKWRRTGSFMYRTWLSSTIVDERNFDTDDTKYILEFNKKYSDDKYRCFQIVLND